HLDACYNFHFYQYSCLSVQRTSLRTLRRSRAPRIGATSRWGTGRSSTEGVSTPPPGRISSPQRSCEPTESDASEVGALERSSIRSEEHTSELQSRVDLVCRLLLEKKKKYECSRGRL